MKSNHNVTMDAISSLRKWMFAVRNATEILTMLSTSVRSVARSVASPASSLADQMVIDVTIVIIRDAVPALFSPRSIGFECPLSAPHKSDLELMIENAARMSIG